MVRIILYLLLFFWALPIHADDDIGEPIDPGLAVVPYRYARINAAENETTGFYYDLEDAASGKEPALALSYGNLRYVSYSEKSLVNGDAYVKTKEGFWMRGSPTEIVSVPNGRTFTKLPVPFGWILKDVQASAYSGVSPDINAPILKAGTVLPFTEVTELYGTAWYRVGEKAWVDGGNFGAISFDYHPEFEPGNSRWIVVDLKQQVLAAYEGETPVFAALIASGVEDFTRPGVFPIRQKLISEDMTGALKADRSDYFYLEDVPYTMYFDEERAIHGIYWPAVLGYPQSHGCINMTIGDAHWLYDWAAEGDRVWILDLL